MLEYLEPWITLLIVKNDPNSIIKLHLKQILTDLFLNKKIFKILEFFSKNSIFLEINLKKNMKTS